MCKDEKNIVVVASDQRGVFRHYISYFVKEESFAWQVVKSAFIQYFEEVEKSEIMGDDSSVIYVEILKSMGKVLAITDIACHIKYQNGNVWYQFLIKGLAFECLDESVTAPIADEDIATEQKGKNEIVLIE